MQRAKVNRSKKIASVYKSPGRDTNRLYVTRTSGRQNLTKIKLTKTQLYLIDTGEKKKNTHTLLIPLPHCTSATNKKKITQ